MVKRDSASRLMEARVAGQCAQTGPTICMMADGVCANWYEDAPSGICSATWSWSGRDANVPGERLRARGRSDERGAPDMT